MMTSLGGLSLVIALLTPDEEAAPRPRITAGAPISADAPWALAPDDGPRTYYESLFGPDYDPTLVAPIRDGTLVYDGESLTQTLLAEQGLPLPALDHEPTAGILYLAMDGVTISPKCNGPVPQQANAALNCSPLVSQVTNFPGAQGGESTKAAVYQKLLTYYQAFNLVLTVNRPPDYLPYTMAVIGGTSQNAGQGQGVCGIANVACDGAKRNHVSLTFPSSCGQSAEVAAQETAHNWGLEHTDVQADLMYPYVAGGNSFRDECMDISHATGNGITSCPHVHKLYCPDGQGEQQNSRAELLGVFGPREEDTVAPQITSVSPPDGSVFTTADSFQVKASLSDDNNMVGVRWTWLEGLPEAYKESGYTRCTNDVCTDSYPAWRDIEVPWDLLTLSKPPAGTYKFKIEVMDAYGNSDSETITITVMPAEGDPTTTGEPDPTTGEPDPTTGEPDPTTSGGGSGEETTTGGGGEVTGAVNPSGAGTGITGAGPGMTEEDPDDGCNCQAQRRPGAGWLLLLAPLLSLRRRRRA